MKYTIICLSILQLVGICFASSWGSYNQCCYEYSFTYIHTVVLFFCSMRIQEQNCKVRWYT